MECGDFALSGVLYAVKNILNIIMIIAPILAIVCFSLALIKSVMNPDDKKNIPKLKNTGVALLVVFLIPVIVNAFMALLGSNTQLSSCWNGSKKPSTKSEYIDPYKGEKQTFLIDASEYEKGVPKQLSFDCKSSKVKAQFSCETLKIVENHLYDFDYNTFSSYMNSHGGADAYIRGLGGVFTKYRDFHGKVKTVREFQEVSEYVFGLMYMYGFDYYSGSKYCKWGGSCGGYSSSDDAFYPGAVHHTSDGLSNHTDFDALITGKGEVNMTTNCNWTVDMVYNKAGIWHGGKGASPKSMCAGSVVESVSNYQVGDVIHFYRSAIDIHDSSTWNDWYHVAYVGEVYDDHVVVYDGGSYLTINRNHKWTIKKSDKSNKRVACHVIDLQ